MSEDFRLPRDVRPDDEESFPIQPVPADLLDLLRPDGTLRTSLPQLEDVLREPEEVIDFGGHKPPEPAPLKVHSMAEATIHTCLVQYTAWLAERGLIEPGAGLRAVAEFWALVEAL